MVIIRFIVPIFAVSLMVPSASTVFGQNYPNKPIRIVTVTVGGGLDLASRLISQGISGPLGQQVIIDNRASTQVGGVVAQAPPDGYTIMYAGGGFMFTPLLQKTPYDPLDFAPITQTAKAPQVLVVHPSLPVKTVRELIALAKARPGELNFAVTSPGGGASIGTELFKSMAGINIVRINYTSGSMTLNDLLGGQLHLMLSDAATVSPYAKSGKLRALAVTSLEPSILYPGLPTVAATGLPGYEMVGIDAMWAPPATPATMVNRLNQEIVRFLQTAEAKEKMIALGLEVVGSSPEQLAVTMRHEIAKTAKVLKEAGIKLQ